MDVLHKYIQEVGNAHNRVRHSQKSIKTSIEWKEVKDKYGDGVL